MEHRVKIALNTDFQGSKVFWYFLSYRKRPMGDVFGAFVFYTVIYQYFIFKLFLRKSQTSQTDEKVSGEVTFRV